MLTIVSPVMVVSWLRLLGLCDILSRLTALLDGLIEIVEAICFILFDFITLEGLEGNGGDALAANRLFTKFLGHGLNEFDVAL